MTACKVCITHGVDILYYLYKSDFEKALTTCKALIEILESYKRSC